MRVAVGVGWGIGGGGGYGTQSKNFKEVGPGHPQVLRTSLPGRD